MRKYFGGILVLCGAVHAEVSSDVTRIEEVFVSASKNDTTENEFAGSVSIHNKNNLLKKGYRDLSQIADQTPGLFTLGTGDRNPTRVVIRGLNFESISSNDSGGDGGSVASYFDDVPLQGYFAPPDVALVDLEQVEVLRGPQGTLYGASSLSGLVRYVTNKPGLDKLSSSYQSKVSQTKQSSGFNHEHDLVVNVPILDDALAVRAVYSKQNKSGFIDNDSLLDGAEEDINNSELDVYRISLLWKQSDDFTLSIMHQTQESYVGDRQAVNSEFTGDNFSAANRYSQPLEGSLALSNIKAEGYFKGVDLSFSTSHYRYDEEQQIDQTDFILRLDELWEWGFYSAYPEFSAFNRSEYDVEKLSHELNLRSTNEGSLNWLVGAYYSEDDFSGITFDVTPGFSEFLLFDREDNIDYYATQDEALSSTAIFGQVSYELTSTLMAEVGMRSFRYEDEIKICDTYPISYGISGSDIPLDCLDGDDSFNGNLHKASLNYSPSMEKNIYVLLSEGFRRGGANAIPTSIQNQREYLPDTSMNYEVGARYGLFDQRVNINSSIFRVDWNDIQVSTFNEEGYGIISNAGEARSLGVELELDVNISSLLSIQAGYAYVDARISETALNINGDGGNAIKNDALPGVPSNQASVLLQMNRSAYGAMLDAGLGLSYTGSVKTALNSGFDDFKQLPDFATVNFHTSVSKNRWSVQLFVKNLTNERVVTGQRGATYYGERGRFDYINRPRTVGVNLQLSF